MGATNRDKGGGSEGASALEVCWKVIFAKSHLKRRCFSDGFFVLADSGKHYLLRDEKQAQLGKLASDPTLVQPDAEFEVGPYVVQVEHVVQAEDRPQPTPRMDMKKRKANVVEEEEEEASMVGSENTSAPALRAIRPRHISVTNAPTTAAVSNTSLLQRFALWKIVTLSHNSRACRRWIHPLRRCCDHIS